MRYTRIAVLVLFFGMAQGCSLAQPVADRVADGIMVYCNEPYNARLVIRESVNQKLGARGHEIRVTCAGDPPVVGQVPFRADRERGR